MQPTGYHQANMIHTQVLSEIRDVKSFVDMALAQINHAAQGIHPLLDMDQLYIDIPSYECILKMMIVIQSLKDKVRNLIEQNHKTSNQDITGGVLRTNISRHF